MLCRAIKLFPVPTISRVTNRPAWPRPVVPVYKEAMS